MNNKKIYFISGLPRSGSTLLSSVLRQNETFFADISSSLQPYIEESINFFSFCEQKEIIKDEQIKNILISIFEGFYKHVNNEVIFDTNRLWTRNSTLLKTLFPQTKIICCVRDIKSILNSFENIFDKNPLRKNIITENSNGIFSRIDSLMEKDGLIKMSWESLLESYIKNPEMLYFFEYQNFCTNPESEIKKLYNFLEIEYFTHNFKELHFSNDLYDSILNVKGLHDVRSQIEVKKIKNMLPNEICEKYSSMEFWINKKINYF
jgi:sulfotransferase